MADNNSTSESWWSTIPGTITAIATLITAIGGLIVILNTNGCLRKNDGNAKVSTVMDTSSQPTKLRNNPMSDSTEPSINVECKPIDLNTLENIADLPVDKKESEFLELGFDFHSEEKDVSPGSLKVYTRCWTLINENSYNFYQNLALKFNENYFSFTTYSKSNYLSLRSSIESSPEFNFVKKHENNVDEYQSNKYIIMFLVRTDIYITTIKSK